MPHYFEGDTEMMKRNAALLMCLGLCLFLTGSVLAAGEPIAISKVKAGAITVDGSLNEWSGPATYVSSGLIADAADVKNDDDLSFFGMFAYDDDNLYLAFRVIDDVLVFERSGSDSWQTDCVEVWLAGSQIGFTLANGKTPEIANWHGMDTTGTKLAVVPAASGYVVEASIPLTAIKSIIGKDPASGVSFPISFGADDCDTKGGSREGQIYFPKGWAWGSTASFATATFQ